jgi:hypothetical protein
VGGVFCPNDPAAQALQFPRGDAIVGGSASTPPTEGFRVNFRIGIFDFGEWNYRAEGREAIRLIDGLDAITVLQGLADGRSIRSIDLRAVLDQEGSIVCLKSSEAKAAEVANQEEGRRVVFARIEPVTSAAELIIAQDS